MTTWLAIDPGSTESAFVVWNGREISQHGKEPNEEVLRKVIKSQIGADRFAVEMIMGSYGQNVGLELIETAVFIGKLELAWKMRSMSNYTEPVRIPRKTAVTHVTGNPKANDSNVRAAIIDKWGGPTKALAKAKKCPKCKGKWPKLKDEFAQVFCQCPVCNDTGWIGTNGPLVGITADRWAALAVLITAIETTPVQVPLDEVEAQAKGIEIPNLWPAEEIRAMCAE